MEKKPRRRRERSSRPTIKEKEKLILAPVPVVGIGAGGTWQMKFDQAGKQQVEQGQRSLGDVELGKIRESLEQMPAAEREKQTARIIYSEMQTMQPEEEGFAKYLSSWCPNLENLVEGPFTILYSGDSSNLRASVVAPLITILVQNAIREPQKTTIAGQGTDTADTALLSVIDALTFDTELAPFIFTGANKSYMEPNSDAPENFTDLARVARKDIGSGAFWVFHGHLYKAADLEKIDPQETRTIEGKSTFWAPNQTSVEIDNLLRYGSEVDVSKRKSPSLEHVTQKITMESLYDALTSVYTVDLGNQNSVAIEVEQILNPANRAIVVAGHGLGNVDNEIKAACVEAAKMGKLVTVVSRAAVGEVNDRYAGSLLDTNTNPEELQGTGAKVISGQKLNKTAARAIAVRALLEGRSQDQTQELVNQYYSTRFLE